MKAIFRRGQAYSGRNDFSEALTDFAKVQALAPGDKGVLKEIAKLKQEQQKQTEKDRAMYAKMFK